MTESAESHSVKLKVYDISRGLAANLSPIIVGKQIGGIWHTGICVYGLEYFYGGGILSMPPVAFERDYGMSPTREITLGNTKLSKEVFHSKLAEMHPRFTEQTYDLIHWNCNHFTDECAKLLLGEGIAKEYVAQHEEIMETPFGQTIISLLQKAQQRMQEQMRQADSTSLFTASRDNVNLLNNNSAVSPEHSVSPPALLGGVAHPFQNSPINSKSEQNSSNMDNGSTEGVTHDSRDAEFRDAVKQYIQQADVNAQNDSDVSASPSASITKLTDQTDVTDQTGVTEQTGAVGRVEKPSDTSEGVRKNDASTTREPQGDKPKKVEGLLLMRRLATNILTKPTNEKFRVAKKTSAAMSKVLEMPGAARCIILLGFEESGSTFVFPQPKATTLQTLRRRNLFVEETINQLAPGTIAIRLVETASSNSSQSTTPLPEQPQIQPSTIPQTAPTPGIPANAIEQFRHMFLNQMASSRNVSNLLSQAVGNQAPPNTAAPPSGQPGSDTTVQPNTTVQSAARNFSFQLEQLNAMGFTDTDKCIRILNEVSGNLNNAIDRLIADV